MRPQQRVGVRNPAECRSKGLAHAGARPLPRGRRHSAPPCQTERACKLPGYEVDLRSEAAGRFHVVAVLRLLEVLMELLNPRSVAHLGLGIEDLSRVSQPSREAPRSASGSSSSWGASESHEVQNVELPAGVDQQGVKIAETLPVPHAYRDPRELDAPVLTLEPEGGGVLGRVLRGGSKSLARRIGVRGQGGR